MPPSPSRSRLPMFAWLGLGCLGSLVLILIVGGVAGMFALRTQRAAELQRQAAVRASEAAESAALRLQEGAEAGDPASAPGSAVAAEEGARPAPDQGEAALPDWIPLPPGLAAGSLQTDSTGSREGTFNAETATDPDSVLAFYRQNLGAAGYRMREETFSLGADSSQATVVASDPQTGRQLGLLIRRSEQGGSLLSGQYAEGKQ